MRFIDLLHSLFTPKSGGFRDIQRFQQKVFFKKVLREFRPFFFITFFLFICLFLTICGSGCASTRIDARSEFEDFRIVGENARSIGYLEATVTSLDRIIADSQARIETATRASITITDGIDNLIFLFDEYESEVGRILNEITRVRNKIEELTREIE